ncbi:hypothetical protein AB1Y20_005172 [Prymnesium parvum]|uniref:RNA helicase n=1 Tax=Prymnesium parvum TaxID=97485 RepID=A0AB34J543_PRYPA
MKREAEARLFWRPGGKRPDRRALESELEAEGVSVHFNPHASLSLAQQRRRLPIFDDRRALLFAIEKFATTVVVGHTGCGKTTQLPQYLHEAGWTDHAHLVACTQPRRLAATSVAARVALEMGCELGAEVGYAVRFDEVWDAARTRIKYMTDGMLTRELLSDPLLTRYSVVIVDEAHERSVHTDVLLGLLKRVQLRRPELRLVIASATVDAEAFRDFFERSAAAEEPSATIISLHGSGNHPVKWHFTQTAVPDYVRYAVETVLELHARRGGGDVLVFLTGQQEVEAAVAMLHDAHTPGKLLPLPLFSGLSTDAQLAVFESAPRGVRKVVVATNIAETSLTIEGIVYVVDCGFTKQRFFNPRSGVEALVVTPEPQASARQRAGRAGRTRPGEYYLLMPESSFHSLAADAVPEMQRCSLAAVLLQLKALGIDDVLRFEFMSPPPPENLACALEQLYALGAIDREGKLTPRLGERMCQLPLEPPLARALLAAEEHSCVAEMLGIAAMLSGQSAFRQMKPADLAVARAPFAVYEGDAITTLNVLRKYVRKSAAVSAQRCTGWCRKHLLNQKVLQRAVRVRAQLAAHLRRLGVKETRAEDAPSLGGTTGTDAIRRALAAGFFAQAATASAGAGRYRRVHGGGELRLHLNSVLYKAPPDCLIYHETVVSEHELILAATKIDIEWLAEVAPHFYEMRHAAT